MTLSPMHHTIAELFQASLLIVGALFPIVNGLDNIPIFLALTPDLSNLSRAVLARKIAVYGFALLIISVLSGTHILAFFGISLPVVQVGGGMVVIAAGWKLLNRADEDERTASAATKMPATSYLSRRAFYPLTMPLTVGPGSVSVAIAVGAGQPHLSEPRWVLLLAAFLGCAAIAVAIYLMYRFAEPIGRLFGDTAMDVIIRLSAFILVCIGVQIVWNGVSALVQTIHVRAA